MNNVLPSIKQSHALYFDKTYYHKPTRKAKLETKYKKIIIIYDENLVCIKNTLGGIRRKIYKPYFERLAAFMNSL